jgi:hypothetical protein
MQLVRRDQELGNARVRVREDRKDDAGPDELS